MVHYTRKFIPILKNGVTQTTCFEIMYLDSCGATASVLQKNMRKDNYKFYVTTSQIK